jgi:hypothetical protein
MSYSGSGLLPLSVSPNNRTNVRNSRSSWERQISKKSILGCILLLFFISFIGLILVSTLDAPISSSDGQKILSNNSSSKK